MSHQSRLTVWVCGLAVAGVLAPPAVAPAAATSPPCGTGTVVNSPTVGTDDELYGIAAVNPHDVWAVGRYIENNSRNISRVLVEHWAGRRWQLVGIPQPAAHNAYLYAVAAVSAADIWAVGNTSDARYLAQRTLVEHWDGSAWHIVPDPMTGVLDAVAAGSASDVWAVGDGQGGIAPSAPTLVEHWDGTRWQRVASPSPGRFVDDLEGVSVAGPDSVWAVGSTGTTKHGSFAALTEHWNGTRWSVVTGPRLGIDSELRAVTSAGRADVWAVGDYYENTPTGTAVLTLAERWGGARWSTVNSPSPGGDDDFASVAAVSADDIWAVGSAVGSPALAARWNGHDWSRIAAPYHRRALNILFAVSAPSQRDIWAAGEYISLRNYSTHALVENLCPR